MAFYFCFYQCDIAEIFRTIRIENWKEYQEKANVYRREKINDSFSLNKFVD